MNISSDTPIIVVGLGRVGTPLARRIKARGLNLWGTIDPTHSLDDTAESAHPAMRTSAVTSQRDAHPSGVLPVHGTRITSALLPAGAVILLAVPDPSLQAVIEELCALLRDAHDRLILHTSGLRGASILSPLMDRGAQTAMFHPAQSFPRRDLDPARLDAITCGIDADDDAWASVAALARLLGWHPLRLDPAHIALYHAACVLTGNLLPAIVAAAESLLSTCIHPSIAHAGIAESPAQSVTHAFDPMVLSVLNEIMRGSAQTALTGPAMRGDAAAIRAHLDAIRVSHPDLLHFYAEATALIVRTAGVDDELRARVLSVLSAAEGSPQ